IGTTVNRALANNEDRLHSHGFTGSIEVTSAEHAGIALSHNDNGPSDGTKTVSGGTSLAPSGIPYWQLLMRRKTAFPRNTNPTQGVQQYVVTFYNNTNCPTGWKPTPTTSGRFLVGLPDSGIPGTAFGGDPLTPALDPQHAHTVSGSVSTTSTGIELASGCC